MCLFVIKWDKANVITSDLKLFVEISNIFMRHKSPIINLYFRDLCGIYLELKEWCKNSEDYISSLATRTRSKFKEY